MSVSYESAMATLTAMFAEVDPEVVAMILQANKGHMEATVENLLVMTGQAAAIEGQQRQPPQPAQQPRASQPALNYVHPHHPSPSYPALGPAGPIHQPGRRDSYSNEQKAGPQPPLQHQPMPPHPQQPPADPSADDVYRLPDDFLRGPSYFSSLVGSAPSNLIRQRAAAGGGDGQLDVQAQIDQDHLLAQMLADEDFMRDLAQNPERYGNPGGQHPAPQVVAPPQGVLIRQGPLPQPVPHPVRAAPAAHPHSERELMERRLSSANERPPQFAGVNLESSASSNAALSAPLVPNSHSQLEPLNEKLRPLEEAPKASKSGLSPNKEQQSSFKLKWESLTSGAREKLARLSERFKNRKDRSDDGEGGEYQEMAELNENRVAPFGGNPAFISASEAENLQASYNSGAAKRIKNAFVDDNSDPFGRGANGSDDDDDGENNELGNYMSRRKDSDEELKPLPRSSYQPPSFHMPGDASAHDVILPGANDAAVRLNGIQPSSVILAPSQFQRPVGFASPSAIAAAGRSEKRRSLGASAGQHPPPPGISAPGDSDDDDEVASPAAIARRVQKEKSGSMPLLSGNPPDL